MSPATIAAQMFVLELQVRGLRVRARLNDIVVFEGLVTERKIVQVKLNPWIIEGRNLITLELAAAGTNGPSMRLAVLRGEHGKEPGPEGRLASFEWERPAGAVLAEVWRTEFNAQAGFGRWAWQDAPEGPLSETDQSAIGSLIKAMAAALRSRDAAAIEKLLAVKNTEMPMALGIDAGNYAQGQDAFFGGLFSSSEWIVSSWDSEQLRITPQAGGRLATVTGPRGEPPISGSAGDRRFLLPVTVGRIRGEWRIVR